jgi:nucleotide-binding universal stress UspA family protein
MKRILFPTDFSPTSQNAFIYALQLAHGLGARLLWFHAWHTEEPVSAHGAPMGPPPTEISRHQFIEQYQNARREFNIQVEIEPIIEEGLPAEGILQAIETYQPDMIVMGSKGGRHQDGTELGGMATYLIGHQKTPVFVVPEQASYRPIQQIIFANDFHDQDLKTLRSLLGLARQLGARVNCLHIRPKDEHWNRSQSNYYEQLFYFDQQTPDLDFQIQTRDHIEEAILEALGEHQAELLVMLTHPKEGEEEYIATSLTRKLALRTQVPLLAFHS